MNIKQLLPRRLSDWYEIGPVQRAELEQFAQAVLDSRAVAVTADGVLVEPGTRVYVFSSTGKIEKTIVLKLEAHTDYYLFGNIPVSHSFSTKQAAETYRKHNQQEPVHVLQQKQTGKQLKPCRSPYCECVRDQCTHPGFYDARHLPFEFPKMNTIKPTHQIAYDYCQAMITQRANDERLDTALRCINSDNQIFGLADAVEGPYTKLVHELLGDKLFDWLMWWMYETEYGKVNMEFIIDGTSYDPTTMTLYRFLEIVDAP